MRIHADNLTMLQVYAAAKVARAELEITFHGSRKRDHAFEVKLTGESRRRPNFHDGSDVYAATWDQWGVFLAELFAADSTLTTQYYVDAEAYANATADRFGAPEVKMGADGYYSEFEAYGWPEDAHGDHRFEFQGTPGSTSCTKCSAVRRWI